MPKALAPLKEDWYVLPNEREDPGATQFRIRPLSGPERADVEIYRDHNDNWTLTGDGVRALLRFGLTGWKNFRDDAGEVTFIRGDHQANLARLDLATTTALAHEIWLRSALTEDQRKNLESPPTSATTPNSSNAEVAGGVGTATKQDPHPGPSGTSPN